MTRDKIIVCWWYRSSVTAWQTTFEMQTVTAGTSEGIRSWLGRYFIYFLNYREYSREESLCLEPIQFSLWIDSSGSSEYVDIWSSRDIWFAGISRLTMFGQDNKHKLSSAYFTHIKRRTCARQHHLHQFTIWWARWVEETHTVHHFTSEFSLNIRLSWKHSYKACQIFKHKQVEKAKYLYQKQVRRAET